MSRPYEKDCTRIGGQLCRIRRSPFCWLEDVILAPKRFGQISIPSASCLFHGGILYFNIFRRRGVILYPSRIDCMDLFYFSSIYSHTVNEESIVLNRAQSAGIINQLIPGTVISPMFRLMLICIHLIPDILPNQKQFTHTMKSTSPNTHEIIPVANPISSQSAWSSSSH